MAEGDGSVEVCLRALNSGESIPGNDGKTSDSGILKPPPPEGVSADDADDCAAAGPPMMGGSPGISGVLSRMLPGVPEEDLEQYSGTMQYRCSSDDCDWSVYQSAQK